MLRGRPDLVFRIERRAPPSSSSTAIREHCKADEKNGFHPDGRRRRRRAQKRLRSRCIPPDLAKFPVCPSNTPDLDQVLRLCEDQRCMPNRVFSFPNNCTVGMMADSYDHDNNRFHMMARGKRCNLLHKNFAI